METSTSSSSALSSISFYDFLDRMRNPASLDLVRSIKSFIVSFSFHAPNPDYDGKRVQDFFLAMEAAMRDHPLWAAASDEDIDSALEGLEKYIMTKLFSRTFASTPEDSKIDKEIAEKISLLQTFLRPEHLDIPAILRNEASWLLAEKELQKMNAFKAPREKLSCIMNCCRIINNLLLNASMSENHVLAGADDFLPVLIYVTIKANPLQLHSNLKFIQLYRRQVKLVSEAAYYFTNLLSARSFILDLNAKSLSIDEIEFEESMQAARIANKLNHDEPTRALEDAAVAVRPTCPVPSASISNRGGNLGRSSYPFMEVEAGELTVGDVEKLLRMYKDLVMKYNNLFEAFKNLTSLKGDPSHLEGNTGLFVAHPQADANTKQKNQ